MSQWSKEETGQQECQGEVSSEDPAVASGEELALGDSASIAPSPQDSIAAPVEFADDEEQHFRELESIDAEQKEAGIFELVQGLEYLPPPKSRKKGRRQDEESTEPLPAISSVTEARAIIEAILFATNEPMSVARISTLVNNLHPKTVRGLLLEMQYDFDNRGSALQILEVAGGFQMATRPQYSSWIFKLHKHRRRNPLSPATLETLAIIAYKQPLTKAEIETVRGVESGATIRTLLDLQLVEVSGRREVIGRPQLYVTTDDFLKAFALRSLADLPSIQELKLMFASEQGLKAAKSEEAPARENLAAAEDETVVGVFPEDSHEELPAKSENGTNPGADESQIGDSMTDEDSDD